MANKKIRIELRMDGEDKTKKGFIQIGKSGGAAFDKIKKSAQGASKGLQRVDKSSKALRVTMGKLGGVISATAIILGGTRALGAFKDFESGLIGVSKTTGITGKELKAFGEDILELAKRVPVGTAVLLEIAKSAGQVNVKGTKNLLKFTEVIAKLGLATDLSGEMAVIALARILLVTETAVGEVDRLGAVIVGLGNEFAAGEAEIAEASLKIAQATSTFDISAAQVVGLGTAMASLGIQFEAGSSVLGRSFRAIDAATRKGGKELKKFSEIANLSSKDFIKAFKDDPVEAFSLFVQGLGRINRTGGSVAATLEEIGLSGLRPIRVLGTLASRSDELVRALVRQDEENRKNIALNKEVEVRLKSFESKLAQARAEVSELAKGIGEELSPSVLFLIKVLRFGKNALGDFFGGSTENKLAKEIVTLVDGIEKINNSISKFPRRAIFSAIFGEDLREQNKRELEARLLLARTQLNSLQLLKDRQAAEKAAAEESAQAAVIAELKKRAEVEKSVQADADAQKLRDALAEKEKKFLTELTALQRENTLSQLNDIETINFAREEALAKQKQLLLDGEINAKQFARISIAINKQATISLKEEAEKAAKIEEKKNKELLKKQEDSQKEMNRFAMRAAENMEDAFAKFFFDPIGGKFGNLVEDFARTLQRMAAELAASQFLKFILGDFGSTGKIGGLIGSLFSGGISGGTGKVTAKSIIAIPKITAGIVHKGGIAGEFSQTRSVPAQVFTRAPHFAHGGIAGNEVPAILHRGEEVLTARDPRHRNNLRSQPNIQVTVPIDARGATAEAAAVFFQLAPQFEQRIFEKVEQLITRGVR